MSEKAVCNIFVIKTSDAGRVCRGNVFDWI